MPQLQLLADINFDQDFADVPDGRGRPGEMGPGSRNILALSSGHKKAFRGLAFTARGARVMQQVKNTHGGLEDYVSGTSRTVGSITANANTLTDAGNPWVIGDEGKSIQLLNSSANGVDQIGYVKYVGAGSISIWQDAAFTVAMNSGTTFAGNLSYVFGTRILGSGSLFSHIASTLFFQGAGQVMYNGAKITGALASSTLKLLLQRNGSYTAVDSGPYSAGLTQPSAPTLFVKAVPSAGFTGLLDSPALSLKIAVLRSTTGAKSIASPTSLVFSAAKQTVVAVVGTMQTGGTHWVFFAAPKGFGGIGPHQRMPIRQLGALQVPESYFTRTVTDAVTNSTQTLTSATAIFSALDVGKQAVLSGGGSLTTTIKTYVSPTQVTLAAPTSWSSGSNTVIINAMVAVTNPRSITDGVTDGTTLLTSATAAWTQADAGKQLYLSGGTGTLSQVRTIVTVTNATDVVLSATVAASTGTSVSITDVTGTTRAIELEWQDGDLTSEFAWIDDYPPPAGTHCAALNNVTLVGGCYSDATADPTSSGPGTCIAVSLQNFPESFRPIDLLYLPEPIMSFLGRPSDSYLYVGCRNSIHQVQYVGGSDVACVLTTLWPDVGIANPHGWCQAYGVLFAAVSRGGLVAIGPLGQPDNTFAAPIAEAIKDWDPATTIMQWHPDTNQVVASNGNEAYAFSLAHGGWSSKLAYSDFIAGNALSAVQSSNQMKLTLENNGARTLYSWNSGNNSVITALSHWFNDPPARTKTIWEAADRVQMDDVLTKMAYISIHRNFRKAFNNTGAITINTNTLTTTADFFYATDAGSFVLVNGAGPGGDPLLARIKTVVDARTVNLCDEYTVPIASANNRLASNTVLAAHFLIARFIYARVPKYPNSNVFRPRRVRVKDCFSYAVGVTIPGTSANIQALGVSLLGTVDGVSAGTNT